MARINLLPWRDELRREQTRQFVSMLAISALLTAAIILLIYVNIAKMIDRQNYRNNMLTAEIAKLEEQLKQIAELESTKAELLSRMGIIQSLQQKRPQVVHVFDEIVRTLPEGIYLTNLQQSGDNFEFTGISESNGRVSAYMRNIDDSAWMKDPKLKIIEAKRKDGRGSEFIITLSQTSPQEIADAKKAAEEKKP
ncbi:MAG: PilN domain-containing protein [Gammaproteobacteria bacterium]|nr:PilN domain-containing protein [Gammaproteobacteria bacterium]